MYNKCIFVGRMVRDPEIRTAGESNVCDFTLAVDRRFTNKDGERQVDFINFTAWRATADFIAKYFTKGSAILVEGEYHVDKYTNKDGNDAWKNYILVDKVSFVGSKNSNSSENNSNTEVANTNTEVDAMTPEDDLPF